MQMQRAAWRDKQTMMNKSLQIFKGSFMGKDVLLTIGYRDQALVALVSSSEDA